jgi:hypothetical protein
VWYLQFVVGMERRRRIVDTTAQPLRFAVSGGIGHGKRGGDEPRQNTVVIVDRGGIHLSIHASIEDAQSQLEAINVKNDQHVAYDSESPLLALDVARDKIPLLFGYLRTVIPGRTQCHSPKNKLNQMLGPRFQPARAWPLVGAYFTAALHVPLGHPETMKRSVEWVERSATHRPFSKQNLPSFLAGIQSSGFFAPSRQEIFKAGDPNAPALQTSAGAREDSRRKI